jgi:hypothetical protein
MSPTPLNKVKRGVSVFWDVDGLEQRPELAAKVMRVIGIWSNIDMLLTEIFCRLMNVDIRTGAYAFSAVQNPRVRQEMIEEAAKVSLRRDPKGRELLLLAFSKMKGRAKVRNKFAHAIWGIPSQPNALVRGDPVYLAKSFSGQHWVERVFKKGRDPQQAAQLESVDHAADYGAEYPYMFYTSKDLDREVRDANDAFLVYVILEACLDLDRPNEEREAFRMTLDVKLSKVTG